MQRKLEKSEEHYPSQCISQRQTIQERRKGMSRRSSFQEAPRDLISLEKLFVRDGSRTIVASAERYESLYSRTRTAKAYELQKWKGKPVTVRTFARQNGMAYAVIENKQQGHIVSANQFYVTLNMGNRIVSHPLKRVEISYDHSANQLQLEIDEKVY